MGKWYLKCIAIASMNMRDSKHLISGFVLRFFATLTPDILQLNNLFSLVDSLVTAALSVSIFGALFLMHKVHTQYAF